MSQSLYCVVDTLVCFTFCTIGVLCGLHVATDSPWAGTGLGGALVGLNVGVMIGHTIFWWLVWRKDASDA